MVVFLTLPVCGVCVNVKNTLAKDYLGERSIASFVHECVTIARPSIARPAGDDHYGFQRITL